LNVFTTGDTTGQGLCDSVVECLTEAGLVTVWIIGQSYDGASNVSVKHNGLRTKITAMSPRAIYIWCHAHRLNLVVESVLGCCTEICGTLGLLQELYNFFLGHKRHAVLLNMQKNAHSTRTLKGVSDTTRSWRSAED
jgi:hypothetical protein